MNILFRFIRAFVIDPADDLYVFIFDTIEGQIESLVNFKLEEIWTRALVVGSPSLLITGLILSSSFLAGLVILAITRLRSYQIQKLSIKKDAV